MPTDPQPPQPDRPAEAGAVELPHDETGLDLARQIAHSTRGRRPGSGRKRRPRPDAPTYSGSGVDPRDPQPVGAALERLSDEQGWTTEISVHLLLANWPSLVGEAIADHSHPEAYDDQIVTVRTDSTAWATQLRLMAPNVVARLNAELGQGTVTRIVVRGPDAPSWKHGIRSVSDGRGPRDTYG